MIGSSPNMSHDPLSALRERVRRIERSTATAHGVVPFGVAAIDRALPGGGLVRGALHEILGTGGDEEDGALAAAFAAVVIARIDRDGIVLWCLPRPDLYGPGLAAYGLDPARLVQVQARRDAEILWAMEEGLRAPGVAAVVGEVGALPAVASRRLQLAAERSGVTALVLRRWRDGGQAARERNLPNAAATRWRIAALPSQPVAISPSVYRLLSSPVPIIRHSRESAGPSRGIPVSNRRCSSSPLDNFKPSCADLIRASTSSFRAPEGVDGRVEPGQDELCGPIPPLLLPQNFPQTARRESGDPGAANAAFMTLGPRFRGGDGHNAKNRNTRGEGAGWEPGIGHPRWQVELLRCRGGGPACWEVEVRGGKVRDATDIVSLAEALADRPAAPGGGDAASSERIRRTG